MTSVEPCIPHPIYYVLLSFTEKVCSKDMTTKGIVPIAVGAALAALVFIVVIAYIIGRKRRYQGYEAL